ncbi:MAG: DUF488 domain-containing protein [Geminicoccaceae bacterium]
MSLFTIGYEECTADAVLETLKVAGVELLVDVRAVAASRRPGFSKRQLQAGLAGVGIDYLHLRGLGTPAEGRLAARSGRHGEMRDIFSQHLATAGAQAEFAELVRLIGTGRQVCLLCYERRAEHCHRRVLTERLRELHGYDAVDLAA